MALGVLISSFEEFEHRELGRFPSLTAMTGKTQATYMPPSALLNAGKCLAQGKSLVLDRTEVMTCAFSVVRAEAAVIALREMAKRRDDHSGSFPRLTMDHVIYLDALGAVLFQLLSELLSDAHAALGNAADLGMGRLAVEAGVQHGNTGRASEPYTS